MSTPVLSTALNSRFGRPHHVRIAEFDARLARHDGKTFPVEFQGSAQYLKVIRVPIDLPKYRMGNGRTVSLQEEYLARHSALPRDLFSRDPELLESQEVQHSILLELGKLAGLRRHFEDPTNRQTDPILLDESGFVVNGNRRLSTWRDLSHTDPSTYGHFVHIDVVVLPHCDEREIDRLEARLQITKDIKADYTWDTLANMLHQKQVKDAFSNADIGQLYDLREAQVNEYLDMRENAIEYLRSRGKEGMWSEVSDKFYAFRKLVNTREKLSDLGSKELFKQAAYALIELPSEGSGRLYESIPAIGDYLDEVRKRLLAEFPVVAPAVDSEMNALFGGTPSITTSTDIPLSLEIQKDANSQRAREIIVDVIESQRQLRRDSRHATFLLDTCAKVNALLTSAVKDGLRPESKLAGVQAQISEIEGNISLIRSHLAQHAHD